MEITCSKKVFELRRNGELVQALNLGRKCLNENPNDDWSKKALGWVLYDLIKKSFDKNELEEAKVFLFELRNIEIQDDILTPKIEQFQNQLNPQRLILISAKNASQASNNKEAIKLYRQAVNELPDDKEANYGLGWCLARELKDLIAKDPPDIIQIRKVLAEYYRLSVPKPDKLHSLILTYFVKISDKYPKNIDFIKWWDVDNLRPEDYIEEYDNVKKIKYKSLAQKIAFTVAETVENNNLIEEVDFAIDIIDRILKEGKYCKDNNETNLENEEVPF